MLEKILFLCYVLLTALVDGSDIVNLDAAAYYADSSDNQQTSAELGSLLVDGYRTAITKKRQPSCCCDEGKCCGCNEQGLMTECLNITCNERMFYDQVLDSRCSSLPFFSLPAALGNDAVDSNKQGLDSEMISLHIDQSYIAECFELVSAVTVASEIGGTPRITMAVVTNDNNANGQQMRLQLVDAVSGRRLCAGIEDLGNAQPMQSQGQSVLVMMDERNTWWKQWARGQHRLCITKNITNMTSFGDDDASYAQTVVVADLHPCFGVTMELIIKGAICALEETQSSTVCDDMDKNGTAPRYRGILEFDVKTAGTYRCESIVWWIITNIVAAAWYLYYWMVNMDAAKKLCRTKSGSRSLFTLIVCCLVLGAEAQVTVTDWSKLVAGDGADLEENAEFGFSVSLSGNGLVALVGAWYKNEGGLDDAGAAYIFNRSSTSSSSWTQQQKLTAGIGTDLEAGARFGRSVSLSGNGLVALVGAWFKNEDGLLDAGAAYIFSRSSISSSSWTQQQTLTAGDGTDFEEDAYFGTSVSLSDNGLVALVGAYGKNEGGKFDTGAAYIFSRSSTSSSSWTQQQKLTAGDGTDLEEHADFGVSVSLSDNGLVALVGAPAKDEGSLNSAGAAYIFSRSSISSSSWTQQQKLTAVNGTDLEADARFGYSVSLSDNGLVALVGAPFKKEDGLLNAGSAYIFSRSSTSSSIWTQQQKLIAANGTDLEADARFGYSVSLSGNGLVALVGALWKNEGGKGDAGAAYIFIRSSTSSSSWTQQQKLTAGDGTDLDGNARFGTRVSLSDNGLVALIGASGKYEGSENFAGAAYILHLSASTTSSPTPPTLSPTPVSIPPTPFVNLATPTSAPTYPLDAACGSVKDCFSCMSRQDPTDESGRNCQWCQDPNSSGGVCVDAEVTTCSFSFLLSEVCPTAAPTVSPAALSPSKSPVSEDTLGVTVGGILGMLVALLMALAFVAVWMRKKRQRKQLTPPTSENQMQPMSPNRQENSRNRGGSRSNSVSHGGRSRTMSLSNSVSQARRRSASRAISINRSRSGSGVDSRRSSRGLRHQSSLDLIKEGAGEYARADHHETIPGDYSNVSANLSAFESRGYVSVGVDGPYGNLLPGSSGIGPLPSYASSRVASPTYKPLEVKPMNQDYDSRTDSVGARDARYVIGPSEIKRTHRLGAGNFGEVWKCDWNGVPVAVKVVKGADRDARKQLELEARRFQALPNHPNVINFYGLVLDPVSVVIEFAPGGALEDALYGSKPRSFTEQQSIEIVHGVVLGVAHLHTNHVIHRDLAARNVLLGHGDVPKITDFGMSRELLIDKQHTATTIGPIKWMAPEQISNQAVSPASDVFALGVVMYEVFAKCKPWTEYSNVQVAQKVCQGETLPVPDGSPDVIAEMLHACFQFDAAQRPTARSVAQKLSLAIQRGTTISRGSAATTSGSQTSKLVQAQNVQLEPGYVAPPSGPLLPQPRQTQNFGSHQYHGPPHANTRMQQPGQPVASNRHSEQPGVYDEAPVKKNWN